MKKIFFLFSFLLFVDSVQAIRPRLPRIHGFYYGSLYFSCDNQQALFFEQIDKKGPDATKESEDLKGVIRVILKNYKVQRVLYGFISIKNEPSNLRQASDGPVFLKYRNADNKIITVDVTNMRNKNGTFNYDQKLKLDPIFHTESVVKGCPDWIKYAQGYLPYTGFILPKSEESINNLEAHADHLMTLDFLPTHEDL